MAAPSQAEALISGARFAGSGPCGPARPAPANRPSFRNPYQSAHAQVECASCRKPGRPLWWGTCAWCGAEEEEFDAE